MMNVAKKEYLDLAELGEVLNELSFQENFNSFKKRTLHKFIDAGKINLFSSNKGKYCFALQAFTIYNERMHVEDFDIFVYG